MVAASNYFVADQEPIATAVESWSGQVEFSRGDPHLWAEPAGVMVTVSVVLAINATV